MTRIPRDAEPVANRLGNGALVRIAGLEPVLLAAAFGPLVLFELFPMWARVLGLACIAVLWLVRRVAVGRWTVATGLDGAVLGLIATLPGAIAAAVFPPAAFSRAASLLFAIAVYYAVVNWAQSRHAAWRAADGLLLSSLAVSLVGILTVGWLTKIQLLAPILARLPTLAVNIPHPTLRGGVHPNELAGVLVLVLPLAVSCAFLPRRSERPMVTVRLASIAAAAAGATLILTQSRGATVGLTVGLLVVGLGASRPWRWAAAALLSIASSYGLLLGYHALQGVRGGTDTPGQTQAVGAAVAGVLSGGPSALGLDGRIQLWRESLVLLRESPLTGIGLNAFPLVHGRSPDGAFVYAGLPHAHNVLLQSALDFGLPGFVAVTALGVGTVLTAARAWRRLRGSPEEALVAGLVGGVVAYGVHGQIDAVAIGAKPGFLLWAVVGLLVAIRIGARSWRPTGLSTGVSN